MLNSEVERGKETHSEASSSKQEKQGFKCRSVWLCSAAPSQRNRRWKLPIIPSPITKWDLLVITIWDFFPVCIHNFSNSSIISTQLSLAFCSNHVFLSCWPKSTAAFSGRTLPSSSIVSHAIQMRFTTLPYPLPVSKWPCYPGLASWLGLESKWLILGVTLCKPDPWEKIFWDHWGGGVGNAHFSLKFLSMKIQ